MTVTLPWSGTKSEKSKVAFQPGDLVSESSVCLWIAQFPLRAEERRRPELAIKPSAIISPDDSRRIWMASARARRWGVRANMTLSQSIGLCPVLALLEPDPIYYDHRFSRLVMALGELSPVVEPAELGRVFIGVDGLEGLLGDAERQVRAMQRLARGLGWESRCGWGKGKFVSWVAAKSAKAGACVTVPERRRREFLKNQSVVVLPLDSDYQQHLLKLGVRTLGQLTRIPESAAVSQFGKVGSIAWRLATGDLVEPVVGRPDPEPITATVDFPDAVADLSLLYAHVRRLLERALRDPRRVGWRVLTVRLKARLEQGSSWMIVSTLKEPAADLHSLSQPLRNRLEQTPPAGAVESMTLEFVSFVPGTKELQLFTRDATSSARAGQRRALRWAAREVRTRLKRPLLQHVIEVDPCSRIPERRYALIEFDP